MMIEVAQKHINAGLAKSHNQCPIALALKEVFIASEVRVNSTIVIDEVYYSPSHQVLQFIEDFDSGKKVSPFIFDLIPFKWEKTYLSEFS